MTEFVTRSNRFSYETLAPQQPPPARWMSSVQDFGRRSFLAMPLAGTVGWLVVGVAGALLSPPKAQVLTLWIATGSIFYLGGPLQPLHRRSTSLPRGDRRTRSIACSCTPSSWLWLVFAIAVPFFRRDYTSLPLTVGILSGLMWVPFSWLIEHWVGLFHGISRTVLVTATWYLLPEARFVAIPAVIVLIYTITIVILEMRWRALHRE